VSWSGDILLASAAAAQWPLVAISAACRSEASPVRCLVVWLNAALAHVATPPGQQDQGTNPCQLLVSFPEPFSQFCPELYLSQSLFFPKNFLSFVLNYMSIRVCWNDSRACKPAPVRNIENKNCSLHCLLLSLTLHMQRVTFRQGVPTGLRMLLKKPSHPQKASSPLYFKVLSGGFVWRFWPPIHCYMGIFWMGISPPYDLYGYFAVRHHLDPF
jgi:hypothetical protein